MLAFRKKSKQVSYGSEKLFENTKNEIKFRGQEDEEPKIFSKSAENFGDGALR